MIEGTSRMLPCSWLPGARGLLARVPVGGHADLRLVRFESGPEGSFEVTPLIADGQRNGVGLFSPDGAWLAFGSDRSGTRQTYLAPYRDGQLGPATPLLTGGDPAGWSGAQELSCYDSVVVTKSVALRFEPGPRVDRVERLFDAEAVGLANWSPMPDGRFIGVMQAGEEFRVRRLEIVLGGF